MLKDKFNLVSFILFVISILLIVYFISELNPENNNLINRISISGSIFSIVGFLIAFIQIYKISSNATIYERAFIKTLDEIRKNEIISLISRALQQTNTIKIFLEKGKPENTISYFNHLMVDLSSLQKSEIITIDKKQLDEYINFCVEMEASIFIKDFTEESHLLKERYNILTQLQRYLSTIDSIVKTPEKNQS